MEESIQALGALEVLALNSGERIVRVPTAGGSQQSILARLPASHPEHLGDRAFSEAHGCRFPYLVGEMANGIAGIDLVCAAVDAGFVGIFGAAGLSYQRVTHALYTLVSRLEGKKSWGVNLIHSPNEPELEWRVAEQLISQQVPIISFSAFMGMTPVVAYCAAKGLRRNSEGIVLRPRQIIAKISKAAVARPFLSPPPKQMLESLVEQGRLSREEAELAQHFAIADDLTVEADSGGHTDRQGLGAVFPSIFTIRDDLALQYGYSRIPRLGAAGGLGDPRAVAGAFAMGAAYVVTGSINQCSVEAELSEKGKELLCQAAVDDVTMAPAADMFELGVEVKVLRRGTLFAGRARRLGRLYAAYSSLEELPDQERAELERNFYRCSLEQAWTDTRRFWQERDADAAKRGDEDLRFRMGLVFRAYLGRASRWAIDGESERVLDYQIWCGQAMGSFNSWVRGSFLEGLCERTIEQIGLNLLYGAAVIARGQLLRSLGVVVPHGLNAYQPRRLKVRS